MLLNGSQQICRSPWTSWFKTDPLNFFCKPIILESWNILVRITVNWSLFKSWDLKVCFQIHIHIFFEETFKHLCLINKSTRWAMNYKMVARTLWSLIWIKHHVSRKPHFCKKFKQPNFIFTRVWLQLYYCQVAIQIEQNKTE